jgi:uncharacterized membrane protein YtjA (UPF0391 family)
MWRYAAAIFAIAVAAEAAGLGGIPQPTIMLENIVFIVLLLAFVAIALKGFIRRPPWSLTTFDHSGDSK